MLQQMTGDIEIAIQGGVEHTMPFFIRHHEQHVVTTDTGIIHQTTEPVLRMSFLPLCQGSLNSLGITGVEGQQLCCAAIGSNLISHLLGSCFVTQEINHNRPACSSKAQGDSLSNTSGCTRH